MADTKTTTSKRTSDDTDTSSRLSRAAESVKSAFSSGDDTDTSDKPAAGQGPTPATSYAGSGTTEPRELPVETHGNHYRGSTDDV